MSDAHEAHLNFYLDNGYIKRKRKESADERAQRIRMALYGSQNYEKGGAARYKTGSRGGVRFEKDMEANAPDVVKRMVERVRKWTEKSGKEGQSWGRVPRDEPGEQLDLPMRMRKPRAAKPEPAPLVKGDYGSVDITPEYQAAQRFADEGKGQFTSIHTHPTGSAIPSGADISSWAHPINERLGLLENWYPRVPTPPHRAPGEYRKTQPVQGANPFRWDKPSLSFEDMYILGMPGTLSRTAAPTDFSKASEVVTRYTRPRSDDYAKATQQWMAGQDWMKHGGSHYYDSKAITEMPWLAHGIGRPNWNRPVNTTLGAAIGAARIDDLAREGLLDFSMDAKAAIPASGGHLWSDAIPDLQSWLRSQGHAKGGAVERLMKMMPERHQRIGRVGTGGVSKALRDMIEKSKARSAPEYFDPNPRIQKGIKDAERIVYPEIYLPPNEIIERTKQAIQPDSGAMKQLFGHTRESLDEMYLDEWKRRAGDWGTPILQQPAKGRGAGVIDQVLTPQNAQRILDVIEEGMKVPDLRYSRSWYNFQPYWDRANELGVPVPEQRRANQLMGIASMMSSPVTEIRRGTAADMLARQGRFDDFSRWVNPKGADVGNVPEHMRGIPGTTSHKAQVEKMQELLDLPVGETVGFTPKTHKVPHYIGVTDPDPLRRFIGNPIADSHIARQSGFSDVRTGVTPESWKAPVSGPEFWQFAPWYNENIAEQLGVPGSAAQSMQWTMMGPTTDVRVVGPSKLEIMSDQIMRASKRLGVSPETARDMVIRGEAGAYRKGGWLGDHKRYHVSQWQEPWA